MKVTKIKPGSVEPSRIVRERLRALGVAAPFARAADAVAWVGAVQAQDYLGALWAVGLRTNGATEADVEAALARGSIVRTWPMRGTLHFVAAADARWLTQLLAPRAVSAGAKRLRGFGIDAAVLARARAALTKGLRHERYLARPEVYRLLDAAGVMTSAQRGLHVLWRLAQECFICFGPRVGKQPSFALFDAWLPDARPLGRDEALAALATRYFRSHGPATARDLAWWSGLTLADATRAALAAGDAVRPTRLGGEQFLTGTLTRRASRADTSVYALPAFDELLVGYAERGTCVDAAVAKSVRAGGRIHAALVDGGRVIGLWSRKLGAAEVVCRVEPFVAFDGRTHRGVAEALERYARFLGRSLRLEGGTRPRR